MNDAQLPQRNVSSLNHYSVTSGSSHYKHKFSIGITHKLQPVFTQDGKRKVVIV
jgi:hypothetical protein